MLERIGASEYANETAVPEGRHATKGSAFAKQIKIRVTESLFWSKKMGRV